MAAALRHLRTNRVAVACWLILLSLLPARADRVQDAVVPVLVNSMLGRHHGSGFCIGDGSWVVTCHHVLNYAFTPGKAYLPKRATVILIQDRLFFLKDDLPGIDLML